MGRLRGVLAAVALAGLGVPPVAAAGFCPATYPGPDGWASIGAPFDVTSYALGHDPQVYVTDGREVVETHDDGCTWDTVYEPEPAAEIVQVVTAGTWSRRDLYVLLQDRASNGTVVRTRVVVRQRDRWIEVGAGLPAGLAAEQLWVSWGDVPRAYLLAGDPVGNPVLLGADVWQGAWVPVPATGVHDVAIARDDGRRLWIGTAGGLLHSTDGGLTATPVAGVAGEVVEVEAGNADSDRADAETVLAFHGDGSMSESALGGTVWRRRAVPDGVTSVAVPALRRTLLGEVTEFAVTTERGMWLSRSGRLEERSPAGARDVRGARFSEYGSALYVLAGGGIRRFDLYGLLPGFPAPMIPGALPPGWDEELGRFPAPELAGRSFRAPPASFSPASSRVDLGPGESRRVPYTLDLPRAPLEVMLVFDSTGSMEPLYAGLLRGLQDLVADLAAQRIDVRMGIADFQDFPVHPAATAARYPYDRKRSIGPVDAELERAIARIQPSGGTTDGKTSALAAAQRAVTDAGFRPDATRVVLLATDIEMRKPGARERGYPGPARDEVVEALRGNGVRLVGLDLTSPMNDGRTPATADLRALAGGSGAVAPAGGVDCDSDGTPDAATGRPLVCTLALRTAQTALGPTMRALLASVTDLAPVSFDVTAASGVAVAVPPVRHAAIERTAAARLPFAVDVTCRDQPTGRDLPVTVRARVRGAVVATATATVVCSAPERPHRAAPRVASVPPPPPPQWLPAVQASPALTLLAAAMLAAVVAGMLAHRSSVATAGSGSRTTRRRGGS